MFRKAHITVLLNEAATRRNAEAKLFHEWRKAGKNDTIVLPFSGHGSIDPRRPGDFFFLTYDSDPKLLEATVSNPGRPRNPRAIEDSDGP